MQCCQLGWALTLPVSIRRDPLDPETDPERERGMTEPEMGVVQPKNT